MAEQEKLQEVQVQAQRIYGRGWEQLSQEEKDALATAFGAKREQLDKEFAVASELLTQGMEAAPMIQTGGLHHANWGGALGNVAKSAAGAYALRKHKKGVEGLNATEEMARNAGRDVAMRAQSDYMRALAADRAGQASQQPPQVQQPPGGQMPQQIGGALPQTMAAGGGGQPGGGFPGGVPMRPGQPGAPAPNAPGLAPGRGGSPTTAIPGSEQGWSNYFSGALGIPNEDVKARQEEEERRRRMGKVLSMGIRTFGSL